MLDITSIPSSRADFIDPRTGLMSREWYQFMLNLFRLVGGGSNPTSLDDLQIGPPLSDQSGEFGIIYDQAQLASMMAQCENQATLVEQKVDLLPTPANLDDVSALNTKIKSNGVLTWLSM